MRGAHSGPLPLPTDRGVARTQRGAWQTIRTLLPYLWEWKGRGAAAIVCLVAAKVANVGVPVLLKEIVEGLTREQALEILRGAGAATARSCGSPHSNWSARQAAIP